MGRQEIDVRRDVTGLDPGVLERIRADRANAGHFAGGEQVIPERLGVLRGRPQLVTEVAREAGPRHHQLETVEVDVHQPERLQLAEPLDAHAAQDRKRRRPLHRERRHVRGLVRDAHVEADRRVHEPRAVPLLRTQPVLAFPEMEDRAVVDHLSLVVAPDCIGHSTRLYLAHVAGDESIDVHQCIRSRDAVLRHRRQVEDTGGVADREILGVRAVKRIGHRVAFPRVPGIERIERREPRIKRRPQPALRYFLHAHAARSLRMNFAAFRPAAPLTPPPGCAPAPQR